MKLDDTVCGSETAAVARLHEAGGICCFVGPVCCNVQLSKIHALKLKKLILKRATLMLFFPHGTYFLLTTLIRHGIFPKFAESFLKIINKR